MQSRDAEMAAAFGAMLGVDLMAGGFREGTHFTALRSGLIEAEDRFFAEILGIPDEDTVLLIRLCLTRRHTIGTVGVETQRIYDPEQQSWVVFCAPAVAGLAARELMDELFHGTEEPLAEASHAALAPHDPLAELHERAEAVVREQPRGFDYRVQTVEYEDRNALFVMDIPDKEESVELLCALLEQFPDCKVGVYFAAEELRHADADFPGEGWFIAVHWMKR